MSGTAEYRDLFVAEAQENLQALSDGALKVERPEEALSAVNDLFRAAHTLKGMSATMGFDGLTQVCHGMEDALDSVRSGAQGITPALSDALLASVDAMSRMLGDVAAGGDGGPPDSALLERFRALALGEPTAPPPRAAGPAQPRTPAGSAAASGAAAPGGTGVVGVTQAPDNQLPLDEASRQAVARALNDGAAVTRLTVRLEPTCAFKGVRALLVRKALERQGSVLCTWPLGRALEEGAFTQSFDIWAASSAPLEEIEQAALRVIEVASVQSVPVPSNAFAASEPRPAGRAEAVAAAAAPIPPDLLSAADLAPEPYPGPDAAPGPLAAPLEGAGGAVPAAASAAQPSAAAPAGSLAASAGPLADPAGLAGLFAPPSAGPASAMDIPPPPSGAAAAAATAASAPMQRQTLRVSVERLDKILNLVGELVTAKIRLSQIARSSHSKDLGDALISVDHIVNELQEEVTAARMVPMDQIFSRFPRLIRDLSRDLGKPMELALEGREIELDRSILDEIGEALVHLLRNAADHGIEQPEDRIRAGKPATGTIRLEARRDKNHVVISVEDDGAGIDTARVRQAAVRKGLLTDEQARSLTEEEAVSLIFSPGFSTAAQVTKVSGRGVGVDAVRARAEALGGSLRVENFPGRGSRFRIRLPLTLAIIQALRVRIGDEEYMAPVVNVIEAVEYAASDLRRTHGQQTVLLRDEILPLQRLDALLGMERAAQPDPFTVLVVESGDRRVGLVVDEVLGQQEIAIKNLVRSLKSVRGFGGVTILGDGSVCLILDLPSLLDL